MSISISSVDKIHIKSIIDILQSISIYKPEEKEYYKIWNDFQSQTNNYGLVAIDEVEGVVGYGSILIENKIRGGKLGHIEDIAVHHNFRKKGIGRFLMNSLYEIAKKEKCYKVSLSCKDNNLDFYKKFNFELTGLYLSKLL
tara:strand:+ start:50 stop:472 length:423 start_codon:yes stop_codon:yes gene_type:complete